MTTAIVLLAAGRASRFGAPKLTAALGGRAVCDYAAKTLAQVACSSRFAVVACAMPNLEVLGFECVRLEPAGAPLSRSIALGVQRAIATGADSVLIALADMPLVPRSHFEALLEGFDGSVIGTRSGGKVMPPALFGPSLLPALLELKGDSGARRLLQAMRAIDLAPNFALDIDTPADLERAEMLLAGAVRARPGNRPGDVDRGP